jgi:hypothetical protein
MRGEEGAAFGGMSLPARLAAFVRGSVGGDQALPWASRLAPEDRERLRGDLELVLSEPETTGEPLDWQEIGRSSCRFTRPTLSDCHAAS